MLACEMLRSAERRSNEMLRRVGELGGLGRRAVCIFILEESDSCALLRSWRRACLAESLSLVGCTCGLPVTISFIYRKEKEEKSTEIYSVLDPVPAIKLTVAWNLFALLNASMTTPTSSLLNCASMASNALSRLD